MHDFFKTTARAAAEKAYAEGFRDDPWGYRPPPEAISEYERYLKRPARKIEEEAWEAEWRRQLSLLVWGEDPDTVIDEVYEELYPEYERKSVLDFWEAVADEVERRTGERPTRKEISAAAGKYGERHMSELLEARRRARRRERTLPDMRLHREALHRGLPKGRKNPRRRKTVKLSDTLVSAIETNVMDLACFPGTYGLSGTEDLVQLRAVASCLSEDGTRFVLPEDEAEAEVVWRALTDLANDFDAYVEDGHSDDPAFDRRASQGFSTLATKVLKHAGGRR